MKKKKIAAVLSIVTATAITVGGTLAYLQDVSDEKVNNFEKSTISVDLTETTGADYKIIPGTSEAKDPTVTATTPDVDAYVFLNVTDETEGLIDYAIADGWTALEGHDDVYYREVAAQEDPYVFPVLKGNKVSYSAALTPADMGDIEEDAKLTFSSSIIQKAPFNDPVKAYAASTPSVVTDADELKEALAAGGSVILDSDIVIDEPMVVSESAVLDLNGHSIKNESDIWDDNIDAWSLISVRGGDLLITGDGEVIAKANDCYAIDVVDGGKVTVEGGTYVGNISAVYVLEGEADIKGGDFSLIQQVSGADENAKNRFMVNLYDQNRTAGTASATISGGTFHNWDPSNNLAEGAGTNFVAPGHTVSEADGVYTVE